MRTVFDLLTSFIPDVLLLKEPYISVKYAPFDTSGFKAAAHWNMCKYFAAKKLVVMTHSDSVVLSKMRKSLI